MASQKLIGPVLNPLQIIEHLGYVQIDTIAVIERAHHHTFWTRNQKYHPKNLEQLVDERKVFEYWSHAASYLPMVDYRYSLPMKRAFREGSNSWFPRDVKLMAAVLRRIKSEGPLRSKDFENTQRGAKGWWEWKPAKKALERLFMEGSLEITRREGFQKVYDIPERVIPSSIDTTFPSKKEFARFLVQRTLRHHGVANAREMSYLKKRDIRAAITKELQSMLSNREITQVTIEGVHEPYFIRPDAFDQLPKMNSKVLILSPFDNLVIQRKKLKTFFNFDYQIECYVPASKRKYGYFCLPVFSGGLALARIDCRADRKSKKFEVRSIHYEKGVEREVFRSKINSKIKAFAKFNGCESVWNESGKREI